MANNNKTYYTAVLIRKSPANQPLASTLLTTCGANKKVGDTVCWATTAPVHVTNGGGPQDKARYRFVSTILKQLAPRLPPALSYHPLALPAERQKLGIDYNTFNILNSSFNLLNLTNSSLANNCWLCLQMGFPVPLAFPTTNSSLAPYHNCSFSVPILVQPIQFFEAHCFTSDLNTSLDLGALAFSNCSTFTNVTSQVNSPLCPPVDTVFICGNNRAYTALPTNWTGQCVLGFLLPDIDVVPGSEPMPIPTVDHFFSRSKRAVHLIPLYAGLGITAAVASGTAGLGISLSQYTKLSQQLINDVHALSSTIQDLQDQVDSLAEVVLQNRRGLDLLTAEKGGICLVLQEKCCFYANKSGIVRNKIRQLQDDLERRRQELAENPLWTGLNGLLPYLLPLMGPLLTLLILVVVGPYIFNRIISFVRQQIQALQAKPIQVHYHKLEMRDKGGSYSDLRSV
ncbi:endogenous retrovirus group FC1 Env polyprotein [Talpa occidentalis]|uniref:endogenous retrovirus group FC1 Env polyprotein n=1 Tax=Talpa occidentalis TaxID=50954 RepID=UPI00188DCA28|nr:endogenous retrovirus group FC1 Env polyprotein [Talpa occidentalis]